MRNATIVLMTMAGLCLASQLRAQSWPGILPKNITLSVSDAGGNVLPGAAVSIAETGQLLIADVQGRCTMFPPASAQTLHILVTRNGFNGEQKVIDLRKEGGTEIHIMLYPISELDAQGMQIILCRPGGNNTPGINIQHSALFQIKTGTLWK